jgi:hypothetical protein
MRLVILIAISLLFSLPGGADAASRESVDAMFSTMGMVTAWDASMAAMKKSLDQHANDERPAQSPEEQRRVDAAMERLWILMRSELSWQAMGAEVSQMYADVFTQDEIDAMLAFYGSPAGRAVIAKTPELVTSAMQNSVGDLTHNDVLMPEEAAAFDEFMHSRAATSMKAKAPVVRERMQAISLAHRQRMQAQMEQIVHDMSTPARGGTR